MTDVVEYVSGILIVVVVLAASIALHEIGHLAEESGRDPQEIAATMKANGTYALLEEEISRQRTIAFLAENSVPVELVEEEEAEEAEALVGAEGGAEDAEATEATETTTEGEQQ